MFLLKMINIRSLLMPRVENPEVMVDIVGLPLRSLLMPRVETCPAAIHQKLATNMWKIRVIAQYKRSRLFNDLPTPLFATFIKMIMFTITRIC